MVLDLLTQLLDKIRSWNLLDRGGLVVQTCYFEEFSHIMSLIATHTQRVKTQDFRLGAKKRYF